MKYQPTGISVFVRFLAMFLILFALPAITLAQPGQVKRLYDLNDAKVPPEAALRGTPVAVPATGDYRIDALLSGYQWSTGSLTYSFYEDDVYHGAYYGTETGVREVSEPVKANARQIMAWYATLMNMNFTEVSETSGQIGAIRFMLSNGPSYAWAYYPGSTSGTSVAGDVHLNPLYDRLGDTNGFQHPPGQHGYLALIHEVGHTVGLKHPFDGTPNLPAAEDNEAHTVMTYTFTGNSSGTPMGYDLMALQYLYTARAHRTGNSTYLLTTWGTDQYNLDGTLYQNTPYHTQQTLWDSAGFNHLDCTNLPAESTGYLLDLRGLGWLVANRLNYGNYFTYGTVVGNGVAIYDVTNSSSSDTIYATTQPNVFKGYSKSRVTGNDLLYEADSADTLDLSGYLPSEVTQTRNVNDHVIGLGANGSITIKNYYAGNVPNITFSPSLPSFSINDVSVTEGNAGPIMATFTVTLSSTSSATLTVNYLTADGSALLSDNDYAFTSGTLTFLPSETSKTISVAVNGDTQIESNESFFVNLSGAAVPISDSQGVATILNDDVNTAPIQITAMSPNGTPYNRSQTPTVQITATVNTMAGAPVSGATVTFTMVKPGKGKSTTKMTATTNSSGVATWNYTVGKKDATGNYTVTSTATSGTQSASSGAVKATFTVN